MGANTTTWSIEMTFTDNNTKRCEGLFREEALEKMINWIWFTPYLERAEVAIFDGKTPILRWNDVQGLTVSLAPIAKATKNLLRKRIYQKGLHKQHKAGEDDAERVWGKREQLVEQ